MLKIKKDRVQRRATKYLLNDYVIDYKSRLCQLNILLLSSWFDLRDIMFLIKCLVNGNEDNANIYDYMYVYFTSSCSRTSSYRHLKKRIVLIYNAINSVVNLYDSYYFYTILSLKFLWSFLIRTLIHMITCSYHLVSPSNTFHSSGFYI